MFDNPWIQQLAQRFQQHRAQRGHHRHHGMRGGGGFGGWSPQAPQQQNEVQPQRSAAPEPQAQEQPNGIPGMQQGWMSRIAAGTPSPDGQMPVEQVKLGAAGFQQDPRMAGLLQQQQSILSRPTTPVGGVDPRMQGVMDRQQQTMGQFSQMPVTRADDEYYPGARR